MLTKVTPIIFHVLVIQLFDKVMTELIHLFHQDGVLVASKRWNQKHGSGKSTDYSSKLRLISVDQSSSASSSHSIWWWCFSADYVDKNCCFSVCRPGHTQRLAASKSGINVRQILQFNMELSSVGVRCPSHWICGSLHLITGRRSLYDMTTPILYIMMVDGCLTCHSVHSSQGSQVSYNYAKIENIKNCPHILRIRTGVPAIVDYS